MSGKDKKLIDEFLKSKKKYFILDGVAYFRDGAKYNLSNYRQLSQLGSCKGRWDIDSMGLDYVCFGDIDGPYFCGKIMSQKGMFVLGNVRIPVKLARFVRS